MKEKQLKKDLAALKKWGATIEPIGDKQYLVKNEGQFGLISPDDFIIHEDEISEMREQYVD